MCKQLCYANFLRLCRFAWWFIRGGFLCLSTCVWHAWAVPLISDSLRTFNLNFDKSATNTSSFLCPELWTWTFWTLQWVRWHLMKTCFDLDLWYTKVATAASVSNMLQIPSKQTGSALSIVEFRFPVTTAEQIAVTSTEAPRVRPGAKVWHVVFSDKTVSETLEVNLLVLQQM